MKDKKTIDYIISNGNAEPKKKGFKYGRKIGYHDKEKVISIYNNNDVRVNEICNKLNEGRDDSKKSNFSVSTLYRVLREYHQNGRNIEWRKSKKRKNFNYGLVKQDEHIKNKIKNKIQNVSLLYKKPKQYLGAVITKDYNKTKDFFKKNIKSMVRYTLIGALSFFVGFGYGNDLKENADQINPSKRLEQTIEDKIELNENDNPKNSYYVIASGNRDKNFYSYLLEEKNTISEFDKKLYYAQRLNQEQEIQEDYFLKRGDSLWSIMEKNNANPNLWEFLYASNETQGNTKNEILRQNKIRKFAEKYGMEFLNNIGKGKLESYKIGFQYRINNSLALRIDQNFSNSIKNLTPEIESEFNRIFYS
ncbi:MAG: hypothetical protein PHV16_00040 [Candidatus Nanoarchaeia archaeon]|nr:hypothetical protein [Candidatus Nanoarchaeia archaeon]